MVLLHFYIYILIYLHRGSTIEGAVRVKRAIKQLAALHLQTFKVAEDPDLETLAKAPSYLELIAKGDSPTPASKIKYAFHTIIK